MILFKACLRCLGDLYVVSEIYDAHAQCFQCGHIIDTEDGIAVSSKTTEGNENGNVSTVAAKGLRR